MQLRNQSVQSKMVDDRYYTIYKQFEADFASLNTGKTVTVCASRTGSRISRIIAPFLLCEDRMELVISRGIA